MIKQHTSNHSATLFSYDGIPLALDYRGQGSPLLLFIHGWCCRRAYWQPQIDFFSPDYTVAALDLPGHGDSESGARSGWGVKPFALDIVAAVKELKAAKVILIGHSMGGAVALEAARHLGETVAGVVLVDTFVIDYGGLTVDAVQSIVAPFNENFTAAVTALVDQTATSATPSDLKQKLAREMAAADPTWAMPAWQDLLSWNPQSAFEELQVPIHAINGDLIPASARERCRPFVIETLVPGAGHFLQMEDPSGFNLVLKKILLRLC